MSHDFHNFDVIGGGHAGRTAALPGDVANAAPVSPATDGAGEVRP